MADSHLSLYELNGLLKSAIKECFPQKYWIHAELSEVRVNYSGHCYLEFIEKESRTDQIIAKARGTIWSTTYQILKPYFESTTGQRFSEGLKVLVEVSIEFHELYGYSLSVHDIDPVYTLGDIARRRMEILKQLTEEGIIDMNKELVLSPLPQRIAIISSQTAAGYGDFLNQLTDNPQEFRFYTALFPAIMQGVQAENSIIAALERIYIHSNLFDAVVIIRGGGATSDLSCFDSYQLALHITQFPLPVITGIGHERDETVIDKVANTRVKTPTAAAEFLVNLLNQSYSHIKEIQGRLSEQINQLIQQERVHLESIGQYLPEQFSHIISKSKNNLIKIRQGLNYEIQKQVLQEKNHLETFVIQLPLLTNHLTILQKNKISQIKERIKNEVRSSLSREKSRLELIDKTIELASPFTILKKGYSLTLKRGNIIKDPSQLQEGDIITTLFEKGKIESTVIK